MDIVTPFTLHIHNLRVLGEVHWAPQGVCALVGPNGSGKSTVLLALKLLSTAFDRGLPEAVSSVLGGSDNLRHHGAPEGAPVRIAVEVGDLRWEVHLQARGPTVDAFANESLHAGEHLVFRKDALGTFVVEGSAWSADERLGLRALVDAGRGGTAAARMAAFIQGISVFHDLDTHRVRREGANLTHARRLFSRGDNAIAVLRRWSQERPERWRVGAVLGALRAAFPALVHDIDFQEAGATVVGRVYPPGRESPVFLAQESNGLISFLISMCALVAADVGGVVAIDEAGDAMHPFALRTFLREAERVAQERQLIVLLASHNTVLLDHFNDSPERLFVLPGPPIGGLHPVTALKNPAWLSQFRLGDLYADGEIGTNDTPLLP